MWEWVSKTFTVGGKEYRISDFFYILLFLGGQSRQDITFSFYFFYFFLYTVTALRTFIRDEAWFLNELNYY